MEQPPAKLTWLLSQMCFYNDDEPGSLVISRSHLEVVARAILAMSDVDSRLAKRALDTFFNSERAKMFQDGDESDSGPTPPAQYLLDIVPVMLHDCCQVELSIQGWRSAVDQLTAFVNEPAATQEATTSEHFSSSAFACSQLSGDGTDSQSVTTCGSKSIGGFLHSLGTDCTAWFDTLSQEELVEKLNERDQSVARLEEELEATKQQHCSAKCKRSKIGVLNAKLKAKTRECKKLEKEKAKAEKQTALLKKQVTSLQSMLIDRNGKYSKKGASEELGGKGWLQPSGIVQLAIKRSLAHCASEHLQLLIQQDVSRWTVSRILDKEQVHMFIFPLLVLYFLSG